MFETWHLFELPGVEKTPPMVIDNVTLERWAGALDGLE